MVAVFRRFLEALRNAPRLVWLAPIIPALVVVPEFLQHFAEISIGMFDSKSQFVQLSDDPRRMVWGYLKLAGLVAALLATIRFWGAYERRQKWWDFRLLAWRNVMIAMGLLIVTAIPAEIARAVLDPDMATIIGLIVGILTLPLIVLLVAGLVGDKSAGLASVYKTGWLAALRIVVFAAAVWLPLQWLHGLNHDWAMGQSAAAVWGLMIFNSIVVGALAVFVGTSIHHGYTRHDNTARLL